MKNQEKSRQEKVYLLIDSYYLKNDELMDESVLFLNLEELKSYVKKFNLKFYEKSFNPSDKNQYVISSLYLIDRDKKEKIDFQF